MLNLEQLQDKGIRVNMTNEYTGLEFRIEVKTGDGQEFGNHMRPVYYSLRLFLPMYTGLVKQGPVYDRKLLPKLGT